MLAVIPVVGAAVVAMGRLDVLPHCFQRVDAFLYCLGGLVAFVALAVSISFLFICICPRNYQTLAGMDFWEKWRAEYQKYLDERKNDEAAGKCDELDSAMFANLCPRLAEAQPANAEINEKRRQAFKKSVQSAGIAVAAVAVQGLFYLILLMQGV